MSKSGAVDSVAIVKWMPTKSWLQSLLLTPAYVDHMKTFTELAQTDFKVNILEFAQRRCVAKSIRKCLKNNR